jgi:hypothetical protein
MPESENIKSLIKVDVRHSVWNRGKLKGIVSVHYRYVLLLGNGVLRMALLSVVTR